MTVDIDSLPRRQTTDILVVGAGQAALALAYYLRELPFKFLLADRNGRVGDSWRNRYDSLKLFTPRLYSALPGKLVPGDPEGFPRKDEMADYLEAYARQFAFPILQGCAIQSLEKGFDRFRATTHDGRVIESRAVVLANGALQEPIVPPMARGLATSVRQISATEYRRPAQVPEGSVLVVGDGATGRQIARELAATHRTFLSSGRARRIVPERILGRSIFWWMERGGFLRAHRDSMRGRYFRRVDPFPGPHLHTSVLQGQGVTVLPRLVNTRGTSARFAGGHEIEINSIIWSAGYREDTSWMDIPEALDEQSRLIHRQGISPVESLYVLGRPWQSTRGSSLLLGVGNDARTIAQKIERSLERDYFEPVPHRDAEQGVPTRPAFSLEPQA